MRADVDELRCDCKWLGSDRSKSQLEVKWMGGVMRPEVLIARVHRRQCHIYRQRFAILNIMDLAWCKEYCLGLWWHNTVASSSWDKEYINCRAGKCLHPEWFEIIGQWSANFASLGFTDMSTKSCSLWEKYSCQPLSWSGWEWPVTSGSEIQQLEKIQAFKLLCENTQLH